MAMRKATMFQVSFLERLKKYFIVILLIIIECRFFQRSAEQWMQFHDTEYCLTIGDYVINFFKGSFPYTMTGRVEAFNISPILSMYLIYYFVLIGRSVADIFSPFQIQCTLRKGSRRRWWYQNVTIWRETVCYLLITGFTFLIYAGCTGAVFAKGGTDFYLSYLGLDISQISILKDVALPCLFILTAVAYLQYVVSLKSNVFIGIILSTTIWVCSVFHWNFLLPGNYLMLVRHELIQADGAGVMTGVLWSVIILILMFILGKHITKYKDIF